GCTFGWPLVPELRRRRSGNGSHRSWAGRSARLRPEERNLQVKLRSAFNPGRDLQPTGFAVELLQAEARTSQAEPGALGGRGDGGGRRTVVDDPDAQFAVMGCGVQLELPSGSELRD